MESDLNALRDLCCLQRDKIAKKIEEYEIQFKEKACKWPETRNELSKELDNWVEGLASDNKDFVRSNLEPVAGQLMEKGISLDEISKTLSQVSSENTTSSLFLKLRPKLDDDIEFHLFTCTKDKLFYEYVRDHYWASKVLDIIPKIAQDNFKGFLSLAALYLSKNWLDEWSCSAKWTDIFKTAAVQQNVEFPSDFNFDSPKLLLGIVTYLAKADIDRLTKEARGEGLVDLIKQKAKDQGCWAWHQDLDFLRFHLFSEISDELPEEVWKWDSILVERKTVISNLKDLLPKYDD